METITQELSSVKQTKTQKQNSNTTVIPSVSTIENNLSTKIPTISSISLKENIKDKQRQEFIESERRRMWHLGYGRGSL